MSAKAVSDRGRRRGRKRRQGEDGAPPSPAARSAGEKPSAGRPDKSGPSDGPGSEPPVPRGNAYLATALAWVVPGAGHLLLGRWKRALAFCALVLVTLALGCHLDGKLPWVWSGSPLQVLATFGCLGGGLPVLILRWGLGYEGTIESAGYEYGFAFILTAGLMNLLLMLDAWDIARGFKD